MAEDLPKPMIPIGGRPILWHIMKIFSRHGLNRFILCLGHKSWVIKRYFLDYHLAGADFSVSLGNPDQLQLQVHSTLDDENWNITLAETGLHSMTGCRVKRIEKYIEDDHFLLTYGDGVADVDVGRLIQFHLEHGKIGTVTAVQPPGRFGEIELDGQQVMDFSEKPLLSRGRINGGFFIFQRRLFDRLHNDPELVLEQEPLQNLAHDGQLMAYAHDGFWHPMDNSRDFKYLNDLWSAGQAPWKTWEPSRLKAAA